MNQKVNRSPLGSLTNLQNTRGPEFKVKLQKIHSMKQQLDEFSEEYQERFFQIEEYQAKNSELSIENQNLQKLIQEMSGKVSAIVLFYIIQMGLITSEIERLNSVIKCSYLQIKLIYKAKSCEIEEYKYKFTEYDSQMKQSQIQGESAIGKLTLATKEIERLNSILYSKLIEIQEYQQNTSILVTQIKNHESQYQQLNSQNCELKDKFQQQQTILVQAAQQEKRMMEYENRMHSLGQENERLNSFLSQKMCEFDEQKQQLSNENSRLKQSMQQKVNDVEEWYSKYSRLEATFQEYRGVEEVILLSAEVERLGSIHSQMIRECESMSSQVIQYTVTIKSKDDQLHKAIERNNLLQKLVEEEKSKRQSLEEAIHNLKGYQDKYAAQEQRVTMIVSELERVNQVLRQKQQEYDDLKQRSSMLELQIGQVSHFQVKVRDYESKIVLITQENERLNTIISQTRGEKDEFLGRYSQIEHRYSFVSQQCEEYKLKIAQMEVQLNQVSHFKSKIIDYENKMTLLSSEIERLNNLNSQKCQEIDQYHNSYYSLEQTIIKYKSFEENVRVLSQEIDRLNQVIDQQDEELRVWRLQYADGGALQRRIQDMMILLVTSFAEIEALRARVMEKEKEVEDVRRSSLAPFRR